MAFDPNRLEKAIQRAKGTSAPIELILQHDVRFRTARVDYHDGLRSPHLERDPSRPVLLDEILAPRKD